MVSIASIAVQNTCTHVPCLNIKVKLEESVKHSDQHVNYSSGTTTPPIASLPPVDNTCTPGQRITSAISDASKVDYVLYTLRDSSNAAVAIMTKTTWHPYFKHTLAQVLFVNATAMLPFYLILPHSTAFYRIVLPFC